MRGLWPCALLLCCGPARPAIDVQAPRVSSVDPADGAIGVSLNAVVTFCFDRAMQPLTIDPTNTSLARVVGRHRTALAISVSASDDARCFTLAPAGRLSPSSAYELSLYKGALSAAGVELSHGSGQKTAFRSAFRTRGARAQASLLVPSEGTVHAPLDLASVEVSFSQAVTSAQAAFEAEPGALQGVLASDGLGAAASFPGPGVAGEVVSVNLQPGVHDANGDPPETTAPLGFTFGSCAEGVPPALGAGLALGRDRDAVLLFLADRPSMCDARLVDPTCPDAGSLPTAASCDQAYDPCVGGGSCQCLVPLVALCPGDTLSVSPTARGWNGQTASGTPVALTLAPKLPALVLGELMLKPVAGKRTEAYVEVQNTGAEPLDLQGIVLADCHGTVGCFAPAKEQPFGPFSPGGTTVLAAHGYALLVGGSFDASLYPDLPAQTLLLAPLDHGPLLRLSTNRQQPVGLIDGASGALLSSFDGSLLPAEGLSLERIDPRAPDPLPGNWAMGNALGGTPGSCNSVTDEASCIEGDPDAG